MWIDDVERKPVPDDGLVHRLHVAFEFGPPLRAKLALVALKIAADTLPAGDPGWFITLNGKEDRAALACRAVEEGVRRGQFFRRA